MTPVASSFLKHSFNVAEDAYMALSNCEQHIKREASAEQYRTYMELLKHYHEGLQGVREFMKSMETK